MRYSTSISPIGSASRTPVRLDFGFFFLPFTDTSVSDRLALSLKDISVKRTTTKREINLAWSLINEARSYASVLISILDAKSCSIEFAANIRQRSNAVRASLPIKVSFSEEPE